MWTAKLDKLSTTLCSFLRNLFKLVILPLFKSYIWKSTEINCTGLSNEFGTKVFHSLIKRRIKTEIIFLYLLLQGLILKFLWVLSNFSFKNKQLNSNNLTFHFWGGDIFLGAHTGQPVWHSLWIQPCL